MVLWLRLKLSKSFDTVIFMSLKFILCVLLVIFLIKLFVVAMLTFWNDKNKDYHDPFGDKF